MTTREIYTIEYPARGQLGTQPRMVMNWYGKFETRAEAEEYLRRAQIRNGKVVPYPAQRPNRPQG